MMCAGHFMWGDWWFIPMIFWGIMMISFLIFFARGGFGWFRGRRRSYGCCGSGHSAAAEPPLELLKARFARGDIGKEEYEETKKNLND